jgi:Spy/CpxP family protein refolding chaperone
VNPWKFILATVLIYGTGVVTGALVTTLIERPHKAANRPAQQLTYTQLQRAEFLGRLDKQLSLTPEQHDRIGQIIRESNQRTKPYWDPVAAKMKEEIRTVTERIRSELTPEQSAKFDLEIKAARTPKKNDPDRKEKKPGSTNAPPTKVKPKATTTSNAAPATNSPPEAAGLSLNNL